MNSNGIRGSSPTMMRWHAEEIPRYDCRANRHGMTRESLPNQLAWNDRGRNNFADAICPVQNNE
jgi:hypothetical protein